MTFEELKQRVPDATPETWHQHPNGGGWVENTAQVSGNASQNGTAQRPERKERGMSDKHQHEAYLARRWRCQCMECEECPDGRDLTAVATGYDKVFIGVAETNVVLRPGSVRSLRDWLTAWLEEEKERNTR